MCVSLKTRTTDTHGHKTPCVSVSKVRSFPEKQPTLSKLPVHQNTPLSPYFYPTIAPATNAPATTGTAAPFAAARRLATHAR